MAKGEFERQFKAALRAGQKRDYRQAIRILEYLAACGFAEGDPSLQDGGQSHPEIFLYLARSWHAQKKYARAAAYARAFLRRRSSDASGWFFLARSYFSGGLYDRALYAIKKSLELNPDSADARGLLGALYLKQKRFRLARSVFEDALSIAPDDPRLNQGYLNALFIDAVRTYKRGGAEEARQMLTFLINNGIDGVAPRLYLAHALRDLGYLPEALTQYEAAVQFAPDDTSLLWYFVSIYLMMGNTEEAVALLASLDESFNPEAISQRFVDLQIIKTSLENENWTGAAQAARAYIKNYGSDGLSHALMGEAQRNLGNNDIAVNHFNRAIELDRQNPAPYYGILMVYASARNWKELKAALARADRAGCDPSAIQFYRVLAEANLDSDPAEILPAVQEQVKTYGAAPPLLLALARTYFRMGLSELAIGWYRKVIGFGQKNELGAEDLEEAWLGYIACCEDQAMNEELSEAYRNYLDGWEDNSDIRREFISFLENTGGWGEAADQLEKLEAYNTSSANIRKLALYRRRAGQYRTAAVLYRDILRKKPDDRAILANLVFCLDRMGRRNPPACSYRKLTGS
ncbi:tetratricopeptide repeat protein [Brucepastera parasyntrophica]|uniref:tetratricopeptide repeat protein n=1 Tax=Brucepastera parasyntrophica TaxID=2880008 RepID=UPI00210C57B2|nr:tetratricopeptide repeat protein [Brucepastera parasyntrophica]ULQ59486.1 tetratricopeptide repeat protein [Brucepastera parasyntrophica]